MEVVPGIHWIEGINGNCYLIVDQTITLIDTGLPNKAKKILWYITDTLHRQPNEVTRIVLTHFHPDHVGNAERLRSITGAKIAASNVDAPYIEGVNQRPVPAGGMGVMFRMVSPILNIQPFKVDILLKENDSIAGLTVLETPGHTPGSISLYDPARKVMFTGDTLRFINGSVEGPSERFSMDLAVARRSVEKLAAYDFKIMLGGHGTPLTENASAKVREYVKKTAKTSVIQHSGT